jgi:starch-binding outer membrane protein SusE/F
MKTLLSKLFFISASIFLFASCEKDQAIDTFLGGTAPVLTASVTSAIPLTYATASQQAVTFNWTNPNYQFASGVSSQNVNYSVEIDTLGANFTNPNKVVVTPANSYDLNLSFTQSVLNDKLLNILLLTAGATHTIQVRVIATINSVSATKMISNVMQFNVIPYAIPPKVAPPTSGKLFLVGSATAGGWNNPVPVPSKQFTQVSSTLYTITVALSGGQEYLFIPVNGDWSHKFACNKTASPPNGDSGGDFGYDWNDNFPGPTATGTYKIDVDFQRGKFVVTKQ